MPSLPDDPSARMSKLVLAIPLILWISVIVLYVLGIINQSNSDESVSGSIVSAFFFIPIALQCVALFFLWKRVNLRYYFFNLSVTTLCLGSCYGFWLLYFNRKHFRGDTLQNFSILSLVIIVVMVVGVAIMTYAIMRPSTNHLGGEFCTQLNDGVRSHPFWAITFFFVLFVGVAYLFGFSLAFHDKYSLRKVDGRVPTEASTAENVEDDIERELRPALRMDNLKSIDDWAVGERPNNHHLASADTGNSKGQRSNPAIGREKLNKFNFYFRSNEASFRAEKMETCKEDSPPKRSWNRDPSEFASNEKSNDCHLRALVARIEEELDQGKKIRLTLVGHSDNERVSPQSTLVAPWTKSVTRQSRIEQSNPQLVSRYISNYELSNARAENVKYQLLQMFVDKQKLNDLEWVILPASNEEIEEISQGLITKDVFDLKELENKFTQDQIAKGITPDQLVDKFGKDGFDKMYRKMGPERAAEENRIVLVSIDPISDHAEVRTLGLIDYVYFSIYTITTTGYGDIKPTTGYAKFVTSVANFCEVLFLVVFFNALVSLRPKLNDDNANQGVLTPHGEDVSLDSQPLSQRSVSLVKKG
jgi:hypothetical protein